MSLDKSPGIVNYCLDKSPGIVNYCLDKSPGIVNMIVSGFLEIDGISSSTITIDLASGTLVWTKQDPYTGTVLSLSGDNLYRSADDSFVAAIVSIDGSQNLVATQ